MPPSLAAFLTVVFVFVLFRWGGRQQGEISGALWLPVMWMVITGSRFVSQWSNLGAPLQHGTEGSPIDALYFLTLIIAGMHALRRRRVIIGEIVKNNRWLTAFFIYGFLAILWSDFPFIAFKRWIKTLGHPIMALIILTDPDPANALRTVMKRCAYLMLPLSVLFIKYYPEYGRGFDEWTGEAFNNGISLNKNELGYGCMVFALFFFWNLLTAHRIEDRPARRKEYILSAGFLYVIGWLLHMADSSTSLAAMVLGMVTMSVLGLHIVNKRFIGTYVVAAALVAVTAELSFGIYAKIIELLGRDPNLTDRTKLWADCLALVDNPVLGAGFESFWLGSRLETMWAKWPWRPNQAHNGYIETYLNLGAIGVFMLLAVIVSIFRKIRIDLLRNFDFARLRLGFLIAIVAYNYTEAAFKGVHLVWTVFHIIAIHYPRPVAPPGGHRSSRTRHESFRTHRRTLSSRRSRPPREAPLD